jgi:dethiobiotin synthetase
MKPVFITGTGTGIGKTIVSVIVGNALKADYWKPVQAGDDGDTDSEVVNNLLHSEGKCIPEVYHLAMPASPHIAAKAEQITIDLHRISAYYTSIEKVSAAPYLVIEGAGGLLVPLNEKEFMLDLVLKLNSKVILVSRNYLGSINHSLMTAEVCRLHGIDVLGWIFNDEYMLYQDEIAGWSGYPVIGSIPKLEIINRDILQMHAELIRNNLLSVLEK